MLSLGPSSLGQGLGVRVGLGLLLVLALFLTEGVFFRRIRLCTHNALHTAAKSPLISEWIYIRIMAAEQTGYYPKPVHLHDLPQNVACAG